MKYKALYLIVTSLFYSCFTSGKSGQQVNTKINSQYRQSVKSFEGKLNGEENAKFTERISSELKTEIAENKSIVINYYQNGKNCFGYGISENDAAIVIENSIRISARMAAQHNASDFFVYSADALEKGRVETNSNFRPDSGFFSDKIFTLQENCSAFFILKPDGRFMTRYGSDYFSHVGWFLEQK